MQIKVKETIINDGHTKICVPVVEEYQEEILEYVKEIKEKKFIDMIELRLDYYKDVMKLDKLLALLQKIQEQIEYIPLLCTIRTKEEGGNLAISLNDYQIIYQTIMASGLVDILDIEYSLSKKLVEDLIICAKEHRVATMLSYHSFDKTMTSEEVIDTMEAMQRLNVDIVKIAVIAKNQEDVDALIKAGSYISSQNKTAIIAIAMGEIGISTRLDTKVIGSCISYASLHKSSAPGQVNWKEVYDYISTHE